MPTIGRREPVEDRPVERHHDGLVASRHIHQPHVGDLAMTDQDRGVTIEAVNDSTS